MPLLKSDRLTTDSWVFLNDDESIPSTGECVVSASRWLAGHEVLTQEAGRIGVRVDADIDIDALGPTIGRIALVVLHFDTFVDGRHYSNAVRLRDYYRFGGELRAAGDVRRDQLFYLRRCGFDAFEITDDASVSDFLLGADDFSAVYQYAQDPRTPAYRQRGSLN